MNLMVLNEKPHPGTYTEFYGPISRRVHIQRAQNSEEDLAIDEEIRNIDAEIIKSIIACEKKNYNAIFLEKSYEREIRREYTLIWTYTLYCLSC